MRLYFTPWNERTKLKRHPKQVAPQVLVGKFWRRYTNTNKSKHTFFCLICHSRFIFNTIFSKDYH